MDPVTLLVYMRLNFYLDTKEQSNKRHPVKKTNAAHWRGTVVLESK